MKQTTYFVAKCYPGEIFMPTIVEQFDNEVDAKCYAALMCRAKKARYIVLEQQAEWGEASQG